MSSGKSRNELSPQILEEAACWVIETSEDDLDADQRVQFDHWVRRSPEHVRAYLEIAAAWEVSEGLGGRRFDPQALIAEALVDDNVIAFPESVPAAAEKTSRVAQRSRTGMRRFAVAASIAIVAGLLSISAALNWNTYSTDIGEQRSLVLSDGSTVELNSRSKVRVHFAADERDVELVEGQALFHVNKDPQRPFIVRSGATRIRAVGTQFDVYRKRSGTTVTVLEGRVAVLPPGTRPARRADVPGLAPSSAEPIIDAGGTSTLVLSAGEQVTVAVNTAVRPIRANLTKATAWTQRKLIFAETPLAEAVDEFNRYNRKRLVIEDPQLGSFHVRGTFSATHPEHLAQFLSARFGVVVNETDSEIRISREGLSPQSDSIAPLDL